MGRGGNNIDIGDKLGDKLFTIIEEKLSISRNELLSKSRVTNIVDAKKILIVSIKLNSSFGPMAIGRFLNIHHANVKHHIDKHKGLMISDKEYRKKYQSVELTFNDLFTKTKTLGWKLDDLISERDRINREIKDIRKRLSI